NVAEPPSIAPLKPLQSTPKIIGTSIPLGRPTILPPVPTVAPSPSEAPPSPSTRVSEGGEHVITPMRTLKEDLMHVVKERKISLVKAVALEQDKKREQYQPSPAEITVKRVRRRHTFAIFFTSGVLVFLGTAAFFGVVTIQNQKAVPPPNPN